MKDRKIKKHRERVPYTMKKLTEEQKVQEEEYVFPYHYLDLASDYHKYLFRFEYQFLLKYIKELVSDIVSSSDNTVVLDAGCGDGRFCYELKKLNCQIVGVDYSERAISFARGFNPNIEFYVQDLEELDIPQEFDVVLFSQIMPHLIPRKIPKVMSRLSNVLKENGKIIIIAASENKPIDEKHYQHFTEESLAETIKPYFEIKKINGYTNLTNHKKRYIFNLLKRLGKFVFPFRSDKIQFANRYFNYLSQYYRKNIFMGDPDECKGLIAICTKK